MEGEGGILWLFAELILGFIGLFVFFWFVLPRLEEDEDKNNSASSSTRSS